MAGELIQVPHRSFCPLSGVRPCWLIVDGVKEVEAVYATLNGRYEYPVHSCASTTWWIIGLVPYGTDVASANNVLAVLVLKVNRGIGNPYDHGLFPYRVGFKNSSAYLPGQAVAFVSLCIQA